MDKLDLVRHVLDEQLVDAKDRAIGKVDGLVIELRDEAPPRVAWIEVGTTTLAHRLHPALGRWVQRFNAWMRIPDNGVTRLAFRDFDIRPTEISLPIDGEETGLFAWERWFRRHVIERLPGGGG